MNRPDGRRLRLLVVSYSADTGGAERVAGTLISHLDSSLFERRLCLVRGPAPLTDGSGLVVCSLDKTRALHYPRTLLRLRRLIQSCAPDVILSTIAFTGQLTGLALMRMPRRPPWIARIGNDPASEDLGWKYWLSRVAYPLAERIVVNSVGLGSAFGARYPFTSTNLCVIANPTDFARIDRLAALPSAIERRQGLPVIISIARFETQKRHDMLLSAFARVRKHTPAELWLVGRGSLRADIERRIAALGLGSAVRLLGFHENPYPFLRQAQLFVLSSDYEGLPNALIEAQGLGLPAVSTACPYGPDEIIADGETGLLVPVGDAAALAEALITLLRDPSRAQGLGERGRSRSRRLFSHQRLIPMWERLLTETVASSSAMSHWKADVAQQDRQRES